MKALILDCARMQIDNLNTFRAFGEMHSSLYAGEAEKDLEEFAPYLFHIPDGCETEAHFLKAGKGLSWGIMLETEWPFEELKTHLRRFLRVKMESGETMYFRFYDPRVLRIFLPTCDQDQLLTFFGRIRSFWTENDSGEGMTRWWLENGQLKSDGTASVSSSSLKNKGIEQHNQAQTASAELKPPRKGNSWID